VTLRQIHLHTSDGVSIIGLGLIVPCSALHYVFDAIPSAKYVIAATANKNIFARTRSARVVAFECVVTLFAA
jgi:hypothetical protein